MERYKIGAIGGGFMARAILEGAISKKFLAPNEVAVSEPSAEKREYFSKLGISVFENNRELASKCEFLLLAVKPQNFITVAEELKQVNLPTVISIMAGKTKRTILASLGKQTKVARVMPNLPCSVGAGMAGIDSSMLSPNEREFVHGLFSSVGKAEEMNEELLDVVTGISGSGPAYVYLFLKSLVNAGVKEGMSESQARAFALQTVKGGVEMAEHSDQSLDELIAAVSSKGGTTVAALDSFEKDGFSESVSRAVSAAVRRSKELSE